MNVTRIIDYDWLILITLITPIVSGT